MSKVQNVFLIGAKSLGAYGGYETFVYKLNHVVGLINGFQHSSFLGKGLGTAGVMTAKIANNSITTAESYVGTYVQQIG